MSTVIGTAGRDGTEIEIRLIAGRRRGCYRVIEEEVPTLLSGYPATLTADEVAVGDIVASKSLRVFLGAFRSGLGFLEAGTVYPVVTAAFMVPRAHLRAHYDRDDGPIPVLAGGA